VPSPAGRRHRKGSARGPWHGARGVKDSRPAFVGGHTASREWQIGVARGRCGPGRSELTNTEPEPSGARPSPSTTTRPDPGLPTSPVSELASLATRHEVADSLTTGGNRPGGPAAPATPVLARPRTTFNPSQPGSARVLKGLNGLQLGSYPCASCADRPTDRFDPSQPGSPRVLKG
jgi:hypothetical protein